jgi:pimeloyl-ACP methyl ester carboxylesterase
METGQPGVLDASRLNMETYRMWRSLWRRSLSPWTRGIALILLCGVCKMAVGDEVPAAEATSPTAARASDSWWNVKTPTLGGRQFWGDVAFWHGWRIQHSVLDGHYRLLDPGDTRHAWGELAACQAELERVKQARNLGPMRGKAVIVVHGIVRSSKSFARMRKVLEEDGYLVVGFDYPSTRVSIEQSAEYLSQVIESLAGVEELNFVVHSMGGLLVRTYLREHADPRIKRMVMLGVPNLGANMANLVQTNPLFKWIYGPAGQQLVQDAEGYIASLPTPEFEFAVVAGARGTPDGWNPLISGDDDGTVEVANTRLPGAADFMTVPQLHSFLMDNPDVIAATRRFLSSGALRENGEREPIGRESVERLE